MSNPRELAKEMIRPYVERGDTLESIMGGQGGQYGGGLGIQIGGYVVQEGKTLAKLKRDEIAVVELEGKDCLFIFKVKKLFEEIKVGQLSFI